MMTREMMIAAVEALGADASYYVHEDELHVTVDDFLGFDDEWEEVMREYDDAEAVEAFEDMLEEEALSVDGDFYRYYQFDGFVVVLGYTSFDI